jgi:hypothetical protein
MVFNSSSHLIFYQEVRIYFILVEYTSMREIYLPFAQSFKVIDFYKIVS